MERKNSGLAGKYSEKLSFVWHHERDLLRARRVEAKEIGIEIETKNK